MGGNALKHCTRRYSANEFQCASVRLLVFLDSLFPTAKKHILQAYRSKESFGDMDVLLESDNLPSNWVEEIVSHLNIGKNEYVKNSNVLSIKFEEIQVDIITTKTEEFYTSAFYFDFNDLGNLAGRIFHKLGIKFSHRGLSLVVRPLGEYKDHIIGEVMLTTCESTILDILGLSYRRYLQGFETLEDMFEFIASSKYFNPDIYLLENRNATSRVRDKKRKTYNEMLKWCEANKEHLTHFQFERLNEHGGYDIREPYFTDIVCKHFPFAKDKVNALIEKFEFKKEMNKIFNGDIVGELTGLEGRELGFFMRQVSENMQYPQELYIAHPELVKKRNQIIYVKT